MRVEENATITYDNGNRSRRQMSQHTSLSVLLRICEKVQGSVLYHGFTNDGLANAFVISYSYPFNFSVQTALPFKNFAFFSECIYAFLLLVMTDSNYYFYRELNRFLYTLKKQAVVCLV